MDFFENLDIYSRIASCDTLNEYLLSIVYKRKTKNEQNHSYFLSASQIYNVVTYNRGAVRDYYFLSFPVE